MTKPIVAIIQSISTGRFLLKSEDSWDFPVYKPFDPEAANLFEALTICSEITGENPEEWILDFVDSLKYQIFHIWIKDEPCVTTKADWFSLFEFPEEVSKLIIDVTSMKQFIEKSFQPTI